MFLFLTNYRQSSITKVIDVISKVFYYYYKFRIK